MFYMFYKENFNFEVNSTKIFAKNQGSCNSENILFSRRLKIKTEMESGYIHMYLHNTFGKVSLQ